MEILLRAVLNIYLVMAFVTHYTSFLEFISYLPIIKDASDDGFIIGFFALTMIIMKVLITYLVWSVNVTININN